MSQETMIVFVPENNYIDINRKVIIQTLELFQAHDFWAGGLHKAPDFWDAHFIDDFEDEELLETVIIPIDVSRLGNIPKNATIEDIADFYIKNNEHLLTAISKSNILPELIRVANSYYTTFGESTENNQLWRPHELCLSAGEHSFPDYSHEETAWQGNFRIGLSGYASVYKTEFLNGNEDFLNAKNYGDLDLLVSMITEDSYFKNLTSRLEKIWGSPVIVMAEYSY
ncbi:hypothetical protein JD969_11620 [Planctomycetota bacterium]|nr:hypothetical protein JD969_11620 [Planctomycetota bacterium]